ncbi:MAG TPA: hypothetical protein VKO83_06515, partial [Steroidobacteraceae bacterium]|nr:hypothetical protein [Steroidobacteraceae bacterium]
VPNVVPDHAKVWIWARDFERKGVQDVLERLRKVAEGAALMAGVTGKVTVQAGDYEILVNEAGARLLDANLRWLGPIAYSPEEQAFARELQRAAGVEPVGMDATVGPLEGQEKEGRARHHRGGEWPRAAPWRGAVRRGPCRRWRAVAGRRRLATGALRDGGSAAQGHRIRP